MNIILGVIVGVVVVVILLLAFFEYRIRQPDFLVLGESNGRISLRKGLIYPRHFSLPAPAHYLPDPVDGRGDRRRESGGTRQAGWLRCA